MVLWGAVLGACLALVHTVVSGMLVLGEFWHLVLDLIGEAGNNFAAWFAV